MVDWEFVLGLLGPGCIRSDMGALSRLVALSLRRIGVSGGAASALKLDDTATLLLSFRKAPGLLVRSLDPEDLDPGLDTVKVCEC